ncbi:MAG: hypothetical protein FWG34_09555 [Oscillospiraceae bacterium]|nr:hypothetical protein [Oscillospiraceae bacterium]
MKFKAIFLLLSFLLLSLTAAFFASCSGGESTGVENGGENEADMTLETAAEIEDWYTLPEADYGGYDFNILYIDWSNYANGLYFNEEESGDVLNGEVYKRRRTTEEQLGINIHTVITEWNLVYDKIRTAVAAGDDIYDFALTHCIGCVAPLAINGLVLDFGRINGFQLDKPWWNQNMNKEMTICGSLLFGVSDFIIPEPNVIYFNKEIQARYGMEDFYSIVKKGEWTLDKFTELVKIPSMDLDGNGIFDESDQYGLALSIDWFSISFMHAADQKIAQTLPGELYPTLAMNNDRMISIYEKVYELALGGDWTYTFVNPEDSGWPIDIDSGRALFTVKSLRSAQLVRSWDIDVGILPFPKFDELQKEYVNNSWNGFMCIPSIASDPERTAAVIETLSIYSRKYNIPAYYDVLLRTKVARDDASEEMLDIIYNSCSYDLGLNLSADNGSIVYTIPNLLIAKSENFVSYYEKNAPAYEKRLFEICEAVIDIYGRK